MQSLRKLEVLDIRNTKIEELPLEFGMLENLFEVDWKNTPMATNYEINFGVQVNDIVKLKEYLITSNTRKTIEMTMYDYLLREHFVYDADKPHIRSSVRKLVTVTRLFPIIVLDEDMTLHFLSENIISI